MRAIVLNDGETFTDIAGCKVVYVPDDFDGEEDAAIKEACSSDEDVEGVNVLYAFTGDETGGVALTDDLDREVHEALEDPDHDYNVLRPLLARLAKACDIEYTHTTTEEP